MDGDYYHERLEERILARAYVPIQKMNRVYSAEEALRKGSLFPELYRSYKAERMYGNGGGFYG